MIAFRQRAYVASYLISGSEADSANLRRWMTECEELARFLDVSRDYLELDGPPAPGTRSIDYFLDLAEMWGSIQESAVQGSVSQATPAHGKYEMRLEGAEVAAFDQIIHGLIVEDSTMGATVRLPGNRQVVSRATGDTIRKLLRDRDAATS